MPLALRPFEAGDDETLLSWFSDAEQLRLFAGTSLRWPLDLAQLQALRRTRRLLAFTAYEPPTRDLAVGHVELRLADDGRGARLARVALDPARRGRGLGHELVRAALEQARVRGVRHVDLVVYRENEPARRAYMATGFREDGIDPNDSSLLTMSVRLR